MGRVRPGGGNLDYSGRADQTAVTTSGFPPRVECCGCLSALADTPTYTTGTSWYFLHREEAGSVTVPYRGLFNRLDVGTRHGLRSSFRDWCGETAALSYVVEACLAYRVGNAVDQVYARIDLLERRCEPMNAWAQHVGC